MWMSIASLVLGIVATIVVSHYYFRRSLGKSLTPFLQFASSPFGRIDPQVRNDLKVHYQGRPVENLYEIQFLIANTGDNAIRDIIEPLALPVPEDCELLDASVLHVSPSERKIDLSIPAGKKKIVFDIPLLNSGEFFIVKILLNGKPKKSDFAFRISAEELPPVLAPEPLPFDAVGTTTKQKFSYGSLIAGVVLLLTGVSVAVLIFNEWKKLPSPNFSEPIAYLGKLDVSAYAAIVSCLPVAIFVVLGVMACLASLSDGNFPSRRPRFVVPADKNLLRWRGSLPPPRLIAEIED